MNTQRWIALALILIIASIGISSQWWIPILQSDEGETPTPTPTPTPMAEPSVTAQANQAMMSGRGPTVVPTIDPVVIELMVETGQGGMEIHDVPVLIYGGEFTQIDPLHGATGTASVYRLGDVKRALRLDPFKVTNGPDLRVILSQHSEPRTGADSLLPIHIDLGSLKTFEGAQNYDIPEGANLDRYVSVVIYSTSLNLVFSTAPLVQVRG